MITNIEAVLLGTIPTHRHKEHGTESAAVQAYDAFDIILPRRMVKNESTGEMEPGGEGGRITGRKGDWICRRGDMWFCEPDTCPKTGAPHFHALYEPVK